MYVKVSQLVITLSGLTKTFSTARGDVHALDDVDLSVAAGEIHGIVGPSGAGKSTLVRCLTLLDKPTSGSITVDGQELTTLPPGQLRVARRQIGMVFQNVNLLDSRTAFANISHPLEVSGVARKERNDRVLRLLDLVGLDDKRDAYPAQLSGGQRQRVGIARALATEPSVLLCDEPTSALDPTTTRSVLNLIKSVRDRTGITVLLITHEMSAVREICDSVTMLEHGKVAEQGRLGDVIKQGDSRLAHELVPLPDSGQIADGVRLDASFVANGLTTADVFSLLSQLESVTVTAATIETLTDRPTGRFLLSVDAAHSDIAVTRLRELGLHVEVTK